MFILFDLVRGTISSLVAILRNWLSGDYREIISHDLFFLFFSFLYKTFKQAISLSDFSVSLLMSKMHYSSPYRSFRYKSRFDTSWFRRGQVNSFALRLGLQLHAVIWLFFKWSNFGGQFYCLSLYRDDRFPFFIFRYNAHSRSPLFCWIFCLCMGEFTFLWIITYLMAYATTSRTLDQFYG